MSSRTDLLRQAASDFPCTCTGCWIPVALRVLQNNGEDVGHFCRDVCCALESEASRGTSIAIVGPPGCGKSILFEPLTGIFMLVGKPQGKS